MTYDLEKPIYSSVHHSKFGPRLQYTVGKIISSERQCQNAPLFITDMFTKKNVFD